AGDQQHAAVAAGAGRASFVWASEQGGVDAAVLRAFAFDGPGLTLTPVTTVVGESGAPTGALSVVLDAAPTAPVVVTLSVDDPGAATLSSTSLTFTPGDWNVPRTITVTGVDDAVDAPDRPVSVRAQAASADLAYHGMVRVLAGFTVVDDDTAGVRLTAVGPAQTSEAGATATLRVRLDSRPTSTVTVTLAASDATEASLSATTLTFSAADWNVEQVVTVVGVDDARADGTVAYGVSATAASADAAYDGLAAAPAALVNLDDDVAGVLLVADGTTTTEAGGTRTLSVRLQSEPVGRVVVELAVSDPLEARLSATTLQFTAADWNVAQTVVLTGVDDTVVDGDRGFVVGALADGAADADYRGLAAAPLAFVNLDDDLRNRIVVDTDADLVDGDTGSLAALWRDRGADGRVSLREALLAAAATANGPGGADVVAFDLTGAGGRTIALQAALPAIAEAIEIDGTTDPAHVSVPVVRLDGSTGLAAGDGLVLAPGSEGSVVRGLSITGMQGAGVRIAASAVVVESNHIGLDASGLVAVGNGREGVRIEGGAAQQVRGNAIGGNAGDGVALVGAQAVQVSDNLLGVAVDRATARGNGGDGVSLSAAATDNRVADNVIGGNGGAGVRIAGAGTERNVVVGNAIGTDRGGTAVLGNAAGGVLVLDGAASNRIGGVAFGEGNLIVGNGPVGVRVADASGAAQANAILSNLIDGHGLGIDLSDAPGAAPAPTPNDPGDADVGGNGLLNAPVLLQARLSADGTTVQVAGRVEGAPGERLRVEVFADATPHPSGRGEGPRMVGAFDVVADGAGVADFVRTFAAAGVLAGGHAVSATVTRTNPTGTAWTDTSEYSVAVAAGGPPAIVGPTDFATPENAPFTVTLAAADADTPAASLAWSIAGGPDAAGFAIDAASGALRLLATPDHERPADADADGVHEVDVRVVDPQGLDDVRRVRVTVLDAAEAPVVRGPAAVAAVEDTARVLSADDGTAITVADDDAVAAPQRVTLSVDRGTLSLASLAGLGFELGDGTGDATMRFIGSAADVAAALARLGYVPPPDATGAAELRIAVADAADPSLASELRVAIAIAPVNDAPTLLAAGPIPVQAGTSRVLDASGLAAADVDDAAAAIVYVIGQVPADGVLRLDGVALGAGDRFTQADLDAGRVRYDAPAEAGTRTLVVTVQDASGEGPDAVSIAIEVGAVPPAPPPPPVPPPPAPPAPAPGPVFVAPGTGGTTPAPGAEDGRQVRPPAAAGAPVASAAAPAPVLASAPSAAAPAGGARAGGDEDRAAARTDDGRATGSRTDLHAAGTTYEPAAAPPEARAPNVAVPPEATRPGATDPARPADPARAWSP
ncbi:MAG: right-handed parallel beta-helix repeat-containing protein, partial [Gemmatimonadaceae bacterium]|nr:right-handed parallel beta-helix repeat-containing protein [Gemmatimonadaceae bacterium]